MTTVCDYSIYIYIYVIMCCAPVAATVDVYTAVQKVCSLSEHRDFDNMTVLLPAVYCDTINISRIIHQHFYYSKPVTAVMAQ
jgi:hypothetical protein